VYIYICIHAYIHIYICICIYVYIPIHKYVYIFICTHQQNVCFLTFDMDCLVCCRVSAHYIKNTCKYMHTYTYVYLRIYIYTYVYVYTYIHIHKYLYISKYTHQQNVGFLTFDMDCLVCRSVLAYHVECAGKVARYIETAYIYKSKCIYMYT